MLTRHWQKQSSDFGVRAFVLIESLANVISQRHIIFGFAADFTRMATEPASSVNKPAKLFAVVGSLNPVLPEIFRLKTLVVVRLGGRFCSCRRGGCSQRNKAYVFLNEFSSILFFTTVLSQRLVLVFVLARVVRLFHEARGPWFQISPQNHNKIRLVGGLAARHGKTNQPVATVAKM